MEATYRKSGSNYMPVIRHADGKRETLEGPPLVTIATAKMFARIEISERNIRKAINPTKG